ncbi:ammonium transporter [Nocardioides jiangxiensis]|uniref:Ammonium transporter n=1 Tax=Nocardioides jiangxiensis TaxID=3064524 RepID=A0ABT9B6G0_9ACTN|nr:ammonium transporter [Nocardioides sp. WY-20]MDO7869192.1 ammonium transporter [Nocardioides sp. WY-20]
MSADNVWLLVATALVIFMTPGVAFFYGGLVKAKSVVSMMMLSFGALGLITVLWVLYGYNMGQQLPSGIQHFVGNPFSDFGLLDNANGKGDYNIISMLFDGSFAIITVALVSGAIADRSRFWPWMIFAALWGTVDYFVVKGWVWDTDGWIYNFGTTHLGKFLEGDNGVGALDWAGGTAVHINAGAAALALALVLGKRKVGFSKEEAVAHNVPLVLIGTAILWFGWFGFNAGYNGGSDAGAGLIAMNTLAAPAAAMIGWLLVEQLREGKPTAVGAAGGIVAGLVAITPACAHLNPVWAIVLGLLAGAICALAIDLKYKLGFDDTLDVVGVHMVGGFIGCWFLGFFAEYAPGTDGVSKIDTGIFFGGGADQLITQVVCSLAVFAYSFITAYAIGFAIEKTVGFRAKEEDEIAGIDLALHGEAYNYGV